MNKVNVRRIVNYESLPDDELIWRIAAAINESYRERYKDSVSIIASIEMAQAALKAIDPPT